MGYVRRKLLQSLIYLHVSFNESMDGYSTGKIKQIRFYLQIILYYYIKKIATFNRKTSIIELLR